jgi:hypothetical protein
MSQPSCHDPVAHTVRLEVPVSPTSKLIRHVSVQVYARNLAEAKIVASAQYGNQVRSVFTT